MATRPGLAGCVWAGLHVRVIHEVLIKRQLLVGVNRRVLCCFFVGFFESSGGAMIFLAFEHDGRL